MSNYLSKKPDITNVELTNYCELDCKLCPRRNMTRDIGYMEEEVFREVIKQIKRDTRTSFLHLHHFGDSLHHPKIIEFINLIGDSGINTAISTKGYCLDEELAERLARSDLSLIEFSLAEIGEPFNDFHRGADYEECYKNIEYFCSLNPESRVKFQLMSYGNTITREQEFREEFSSMGEIEFKNVHNFIGDDDKINEETGVRASNAVCNLPFEQINILWNGDVVPCCFDYDGKYVIGNLMETPIGELWNNDKMLRLREYLSTDRKDEIELCKGCMGR